MARPGPSVAWAPRPSSIDGGDVVAAISKRPDLRPILSILEEQGDEIISRADSIAFEIDMDISVDPLTR